MCGLSRTHEPDTTNLADGSPTPRLGPTHSDLVKPPRKWAEESWAMAVGPNWAMPAPSRQWHRVAHHTVDDSGSSNEDRVWARANSCPDSTEINWQGRGEKYPHRPWLIQQMQAAQRGRSISPTRATAVGQTAAAWATHARQIADEVGPGGCERATRSDAPAAKYPLFRLVLAAPLALAETLEQVGRLRSLSMFSQAIRRPLTSSSLA